MPDTLSRKIYRDLFSDDQWDLIYAMAGHALDNDDFTPEDVYSIRNKIHALFDYNDWYLQLYWWWGDNFRTGWYHLYRHHYCYCFSSILFFSYEEIKTSTRFNSTISSRCDSRTSGTHDLDETRIIDYIRHIQNASRSWKPQSSHQSRVRQRIALPTLCVVMHNVSSSNTWATGCSLHHIMVAITSGWCLTKTQTGW